MELVCSHASNTGRRSSNEDTEKIVQNFREDLFYAAIFDGHGGTLCSEWLANNLDGIICKHLKEAGELSEEVLTKAFLEADKSFVEYCEDNDDGFDDNYSSGSTCVSTIVDKKNKVIYAANLGDAAAFLCREGRVCEQLTFPHKPSEQEERDRIISAGMSVSFGRVNGVLAVSRAFGDKEFKRGPFAPQFLFSHNFFDPLFSSSESSRARKTTSLCCAVFQETWLLRKRQIFGFLPLFFLEQIYILNSFLPSDLL